MHAMREQMARAGAFAAIILRLPLPDGRTGNLADDRREYDVALEPHATPLQSLAGHHERRDAALHV